MLCNRLMRIQLMFMQLLPSCTKCVVFVYGRVSFTCYFREKISWHRNVFKMFFESRACSLVKLVWTTLIKQLNGFPSFIPVKFTRNVSEPNTSSLRKHFCHFVILFQVQHGDTTYDFYVKKFMIGYRSAAPLDSLFFFLFVFHKSPHT